MHTLYKIHQRGFHPICIYSPFIKTNVQIIHEEDATPFFTMAHDLMGHFYWGNLLKRNHYQFINEYLLPTVAELLNINIHHLSEKTEIFTMVDLHTTFQQPWKISLDDTFYICANTRLKIAQTEYFPDIVPEKKLTIWKNVYADKQYIKDQFGIDIEALFFQIERFFKKYNFDVKIDQSHVIRILNESTQTQVPLLEIYQKNVAYFPSWNQRFALHK